MFKFFGKGPKFENVKKVEKRTIPECPAGVSDDYARLRSGFIKDIGNNNVFWQVFMLSDLQQSFFSKEPGQQKDLESTDFTNLLAYLKDSGSALYKIHSDLEYRTAAEPGFSVFNPDQISLLAQFVDHDGKIDTKKILANINNMPNGSYKRALAVSLLLAFGGAAYASNGDPVNGPSSSGKGSGVDVNKEASAVYAKGAKVEDKGYGVKLAGQGHQVDGDPTGVHVKTNPDFHYTIEDNPEDQRALLLEKYHSQGVGLDVDQQEFEKLYRARDPKFKNLAYEYAGKVNEKVPPGSYVVKEWKVKPLIVLTETQKQEAKKQTKNYDSFEFPDAYNQAVLDGLTIFRWRADKKGGGDFFITDNPDDVDGTVPGLTGDLDPSNGNDKGGSETKKWIESVNPNR